MWERERTRQSMRNSRRHSRQDILVNVAGWDTYHGRPRPTALLSGGRVMGACFGHGGRLKVVL